MSKPEVKQAMNLVKLIDTFHSDEKCRAYLERLRWPDGLVCPRCGGKTISRIKKRAQFDCDSCRYQFSVTSMTTLHKSKLPLWKWFLAAYTMIESKKGVSANQIKRELGITYKTAWFLCHRIRAAMTQASREMEPMDGTIEIDDTWIGGVAEGMGMGYKGNKTRLVGVVKRDGGVQLKTVNRADRKTIHAIIDRYVAKDAESVYTDEAYAYRGKGRRHEFVKHSDFEWARGDIHTNTIESVWSLFKRSVAGAYHVISPKHLDAYLDELEWRYNNRRNPFLWRETMRQLVSVGPTEYKELTA